MSFRIDGKVDRGKFPKRLYAPQFGHRPLSSPEGLMRVFGPIVVPAPGLLAGLVTAGRYRVRAWHPVLGMRQVEIELKSGQRQVIDFRF